MDKWIPVDTGNSPCIDEIVQVTYIGLFDGKPYCDMFAYMTVDGIWFNAYDDTVVEVCIIAWKPNCKPYKYGSTFPTSDVPRYNITDVKEYDMSDAFIDCR